MAKISAYIMQSDRLAAWEGKKSEPLCPTCWRKRMSAVGIGKGRGISPAARRLLGITTWHTSTLMETPQFCSCCSQELELTVIGIR